MVELVKLCKLPFSHSGPLSLATLNPAQTPTSGSHGFILSLVNLSFFLHTSFHHSSLLSLPSSFIFPLLFHDNTRVIHQMKGLDSRYTMGWMKFS